MMKSLSLQEMAASLELPVHTLERWIRQGRIPVVRMDNVCSFKEETLSRWARQHQMPFRIRENSGLSQKAGEEDSLEAAFRRGSLVKNLGGGSAGEVLGRMVRSIPGIASGQERLLLERLQEREALGSTGVGRGIALPHPRAPLEGFPESSRIFTFFPENPISYGAIDGQPVFVLFLLLSPDIKAHLSLLSRLSFCLRDRDFYGLLTAGPDHAALIEMVSGLEKMFPRRTGGA